MKVFGFLILLLFVALASLYATAPLLLGRILPMYLQTLGIHQSSFEFARPGIRGITVHQADIQLGEVSLSATGITLTYNLSSLAAKRVDVINVRQLEITVAAPQETSDDAGPPPVLTSPWNLIPARQLDIATFTVENTSPPASISGQFTFNPKRIASRLTLRSPDLPADVVALLEVNPDGTALVELSQPEETPAIMIHGHLEATGNISLQGELNLQGSLFSLLAELEGAKNASGYIRGTLNGAFPWPLNPGPLVAQLGGAANLEVAFKGDLAEVAGLEATTQVSVSLENQQLELASTGFSLRGGQLLNNGQVYQFDDDSNVKGDFTTVFTLKTDQAAIELLSGSVKIAVDLSLPGTTGFSAGTAIETARVSGVVNLELAGDKLRLKSDSFSISASRLTQQGIIYDLSIKKLALSPDIMLPWPMSEQPAQVATGQLGLIVDLVATTPGDLPRSIEIGGNFNGYMKPGQWRLEVNQGTAIHAALDPLIGVEVDDPFFISLDTRSGKVYGDNIELSLRIPELQLTSEQKIAFRKSRLSVTAFSLMNNKLEVTGQFRASTSNQALPLGYSTVADIKALRGDFSILVNQKISRPLIRNDLPGWKGDYDLNSGHLDLVFDGSFRFTDELLIDGQGYLAISDGFARYEDMSASEVNVRLPLNVKASSTLVEAGEIQLGNVDAGVPVANVKFGINTDFSLAHLSNLTATVLGAEVSIDQLNYDIGNETGTFNTTVAGLPVGNVLALEGEDVRGDGILDGLLPVTMAPRGVAITNGKLKSRPPGGRLSYHGNLPATNPALDLAVRALRNFQYNNMDIDVNYQPTGELALLVRLQGNSPDVEKGRPIHFNLNVNENIPHLLESLRASGELSERVQQRLSR